LADRDEGGEGVTWIALVLVIACAVGGFVGTREGHARWQLRQARTAAAAIMARQNRIAQLEIELGIIAPLYADPAQVEQRWQAQFDAEIGPGPPPLGFQRETTAEEQAAIERTRARRKEVARTAAQKREERRS
jgi:hypothetical protein